MKPKMSFICCLLVSLVMVLPMCAKADEFYIVVWVDQLEYEEPPVIVNGEFTVNDPPDYDQDYCYAKVVIGKDGYPPWWYYEGEYIVGSGGSGDVTVYCSGDSGTVYFEWEYDIANPTVYPGDYYVGLYAEAWEGYPVPTDIVYGWADPVEFTIS